LLHMGPMRDESCPSRRPSTGVHGARAVAAVLALVLVTGGCARRSGDQSSIEGPVSKEQADRFIKRAILSSPEGVIMLPSRKAEHLFELPRLNEIAQELRAPAAACFIRRAIETMKRSDAEDHDYEGVPEGQVKIRARIAPAGDVVRVEVLESGFADEDVPQCVTAVIGEKRWPSIRSGNTHFVDIVYWVSLGFQPGVGTEAFEDDLRRQQTMAGIRAKNCLQGRVDAGKYRVEGLNLVDREGNTLTNRIEPVALPEPVRACIVQAFREVRLPREPDAFVRPVSPVVEFEVLRDGTVTVADEEWLRLVQIEDRARRIKERAELTGELSESEQREVDRELVDFGEPDFDEIPSELPSATEQAEDSVVDDPEPSFEAPPADATRSDPGKGGLRLDLGGRSR
jgi:hypothetical protein